MNDSRAEAYARRFERVLDYIDRHLDGDLSVARLSREAHFSRYHFHRQFGEYAGISVHRYVQQQRLRRAAQRLAFEAGARILDVALEAGFENPESFSRAFRQAFGQAPSRFRNQPAWPPWHERYRPPARMRSTPMEVTIVQFDETPVAALEHRGDPARVNDSALTFIAWRKQSGRSPVDARRTFGIAYDDPDATPPEAFRFDLCGEVRAPVAANPQGVVNKTIPGGRCARVRHHGSLDRIGDTIRALFQQWLPGSGETPGEFPLFFHYLKLMPTTPEHELETDIYLPLRQP